MVELVSGMRIDKYGSVMSCLLSLRMLEKAYVIFDTYTCYKQQGVPAHLCAWFIVRNRAQVRKKSLPFIVHAFFRFLSR